MPEMFKRSIRGYDFQSVQQEIDIINQAYEMKIKELKKEIVSQTHQNELLAMDRAKIKQDLDKREEIQDRIKNDLLEKHMDASNKHLSAKRKMQNAIDDLQNHVKMKQEELAKYKRYSDKIKKDILKIRDNYETLIEEDGVED